ncbi:MAG TPA: transglutaminase domain-containing protein [Verrucomicrobiota bacterium]|jgi:transglutaminase-like putative cysteine protease|nr:transglutaminase domain-containing protein [Verrucomicrobiota bacterium]HRT09611.1 transglutaminase domain-containing protein [Candidatus Paceibacterota bacterium]
MTIADMRVAPRPEARWRGFGLRPRLLLLVFVACLSLEVCPAQPVAERAAELELRGQFKEAAALLQAALADPSLEASNRHVLRFELDRLDRIRKDFPYTAEELFDALKKSVKDLTREEYDRWVAEGRFDSRVIDGERRFMTSSVSNLFWRYPELNPRRMPPKDTRALEKARWEHCVAIRQAAVAEKKPYVLPKRFRMTMKVTAKPGAAPAGEMVRAWLPIPREYPFQTDFTLITSTPRAIQVAPADSPIRSVFLEQPARKNQATVFEVVYDYTTYGVWFQVDPALVKPCDREDPVFETYTREAPHVVFTPEIRALSETIAGSETNGFLKAKMFHDWIAENIQYSYAIEYSTIRNISDYCRARRYGDCGQEALLFITLCRLNGIPARWQSGWNTFPGAKSIHDWAEIYLPPYGWMPVDPYMGIFAMRYATSLSPDQRRDIRDFYFGGLDAYRMAANSDHNQDLTPPKRSLRSDNVDFQRGELEWGDQNIYFDQYSYSLTVKEVPLKNPARLRPAP